MNSAARIAYRRRPSPLHATRATVAAAYGIALATAALVVGSPLLLGALLFAVLGAAAGAGVGRQLARATRGALLPILVLSVLVNVLVTRGGLTVLARLGDWGVLGQVNITLESGVYGLVFALRLSVVMLACLLVVCTADPDELLLACRRVSPHSALTAALVTRLIPVLGEDARRLSEAQRCRPDGGATGMRGKLAVLRATVGGALDRSLDVAAVLEMRGYGTGGRRRAATAPPRSRHDLAFLAAAASVIGLAVVEAIAGIGAFHAYPLVGISVTPIALALAILAPVLALVPFLDRRGIEP
ncbi:MAG: CbiQ family ECF transporter T component [Solirubrobacteraceae bacterium]